MNKHNADINEMGNKEEKEHEHSEEHNCCCEHDDISVKEIAYHADDKIDALIQLMIKKNIFTEHEFEEQYNALFEEDEPTD